MAWRPLVTDERKGRIVATVREIAAALRAHVPDREESDAAADHALLRTYLASDDTLADDEDVAGDAVARTVAGVQRTMRPALYGGIGRVGWTIAHLTDGETVESACGSIDNALLRIVPGWADDYDLISGVVGFGVYALERGPAGAALAEAVVGWLERTARERAGGLAWFTRPELLPEHQRAMCPDGYWNYGLAHGNPGVVALLARFVAADLVRERSRALLEPAIAHLLAVADHGEGGRYAPWAPHEVPSRRLAWCYGDLGVAAALVGAGIFADHAGARAAGVALAGACARRSRAEALIHDAALCHGALGIAHLFNRMAQATGETELEAAADRWVDIGLALRDDAPIAGFPAAWLEDGRSQRRADASLLSGVVGVGLALHAAISELEPAWDRLLLVDLPPR